MLNSLEIANLHGIDPVQATAEIHAYIGEQSSLPGTA